MEVGGKLSELNMTEDEMDKLTKAFKDEKFREMLRDYAQEISDPENKKRYEEEIKLLERERGNSIEFIHPKPFRALKTSVNGKQKCFINICGNDKVGKPEFKSGVSEDGCRGQYWSLPHSLHPGREDADPKGNKIMVYDVIFHPDTLHIANKNKKFMDMVSKTAIQGIQNSFNVTLDENNVREINTKYKGIPQPCVIRKPIPGYKAKEPSEKPDPLAFPYPDEKRATTTSQIKPTQSPPTKNSSDSNPRSLQIKPQKAKEPTKPNYTVKYRSFIDLQDYRCSRDSAKSPRPKEIVVTIDLPLVESLKDASLEAKEKSLLLETKKPAYRLELPLAYPVDEDKGEAKFNKHTGQLTVTLPVLPSKDTLDFAIGPAITVSDGEKQDRSGDLEEENRKEKEKEKDESEEEAQDFAEGKENVVGENEILRKHYKNDRGNVAEERGVQEQKNGKIYESELEDSVVTGFQSDVDPDKPTGSAVEQETDGIGEEEKVNVETPTIKTSGIQRETENIEEARDSSLKMDEDPSFQNHTSSEESQSTVTSTSLTIGSTHNKDCCISQEADGFNRPPAADEANKSNPVGSGNTITLFAEELTRRSGKQDIDEDDLPTESDKPPPVVLREIDEDGNEKIISDHSTSAGIIFQNSLMYELD